MNKILERNFIAINVDGQTLNIYDLPQLIKDYGFRRFFTTLGFSFGKIIRHCDSRSYYSKSGNIVRTFLSRTSSDFDYILTDGVGRSYSPEHIIEEFFNDFPQKAQKMWKKDFPDAEILCGYKGCDRWFDSGHFKKNIANKKLFQQNITLKENFVKGVRKIDDYHDYEHSEWYRLTTRSWKDYRKNQYK